MLKVTALAKAYGSKQALQPTSLAFAPYSFTAIVGKSGCGKTTLLRLLAGLEPPTEGSIQLADLPQEADSRVAIQAEPAKGPSGSKKSLTIATVFQEPRLMPWLTVAENITLATKANSSLTKAALPQLLKNLELTEAKDLYPGQLSGGMAQRVSLGRTLFYNPDIILMDEPFSALDYFTRRSLQQMLLRLYQAHEKTIIFVTHDVEEAVLLADRVLIMDKGAIESTVAVNLPRPRRATDQAFQALRQQILQALL